jgi:hypothetical protein
MVIPVQYLQEPGADQGDDRGASFDTTRADILPSRTVDDRMNSSQGKRFGENTSFYEPNGPEVPLPTLLAVGLNSLSGGERQSQNGPWAQDSQQGELSQSWGRQPSQQIQGFMGPSGHDFGPSQPPQNQSMMLHSRAPSSKSIGYPIGLSPNPQSIL